MHFLGYERPDGSVGVRNLVMVMAMSECAFEVAKRVARQVKEAVAISNQLCMPDTSVIHQLIGLGMNPNIAGVVMIALGCEGDWVEKSAEKIRDFERPVKVFRIQNSGGSIQTIKKATLATREISQRTLNSRKTRHGLNKLTVAVECGGTDPTSGISANPATGMAMDLLLDAGGTVIMSETGDLLGTADILAKRAVNPEIGNKIHSIIKASEKRYSSRYRESTHGHQVSGLTTQVEKSLGALLKGGSSPLTNVLENSRRRVERPSEHGFYIQDTPNFPDVPSITAKVAAGAQIAVFTTGLGSIVGHALAPVIKVTGNPTTYVNMLDNMDINAGTIITSEKSVRAVGREIFNFLIEVASGKKTKAETLGYTDFSILATYYRGLGSKETVFNCPSIF